MTESPPHSPLLDLFGDSKVFQLTLPSNLFPARPDLPANEHTSPHVSRPIGRFGEGQPPRKNNNALLTRDYHRSLREWHVNNRPSRDREQYVEGEDNIPHFDHGREGTSYFAGQDEINSRWEYQPRYRFQSHSESSDFFNASRATDLEGQSLETSKSPENPCRRCSEPCPGRSDFFNVHRALDTKNTRGRRSEPCPGRSDFFNTSRTSDLENPHRRRSEPCPDCSDFFNANRALDQENQRRRCSEPFPSRLDFYNANGAPDIIEPSHTNHMCNEDEHDVKKRDCSPGKSPRAQDVIEPSHVDQIYKEDEHNVKKRKRSPEESSGDPDIIEPSHTNQICDEEEHESKKRKRSPEALEATNPSDTNQPSHINQMYNEDEHGSKKRKHSPEVSPGAQLCRPKKRRRITLNG
ncbi:hypothetical protein MMC14_001564 [Varicellaria rhodocarpa]|nr:hypothetical protein [Varicellaria rhodocarpa]